MNKLKWTSAKLKGSFLQLAPAMVDKIHHRMALEHADFYSALRKIKAEKERNPNVTADELIKIASEAIDKAELTPL